MRLWNGVTALRFFLSALACTSLAFAASGSVAKFSAPAGWQEAHQGNNDLYHITEYVPNQEDVREFSKIITITEFAKVLPISLKEFADRQAHEFKQRGCEVDTTGAGLPKLLKDTLDSHKVAVTYECDSLNTSGVNLLVAETNGHYTVYTFEFRRKTLDEAELNVIATTFTPISAL